jgi:TorA maturation chaperone TorD
LAIEERVEIGDEELLRARVYGLLGRYLAAPPDAELLRLTATLKGDDSEFGQAIGALSQAAASATEETAAEEYQELFIGVGRGEVVPYGSYYLTGFLHEKPLAQLRIDMSNLGIAPADDASDPEDHIASLCECMAGLIAGDYRADLDTQFHFFNAHIASWAIRFFSDLEKAASAKLYRPVGAVGRLFLTVEQKAFALME